MAINPVAQCGLKRWPGNISRMAILLSHPWRCLVKQFHKSLCLSVAALMFWRDSAMMEFLILGQLLKFLWIEWDTVVTSSCLGFSIVGGKLRNGAVMEKYLGMNFDKYPIMLKKLVTTSSDSGRLDSLTAFIFVWVWPQPIFSELLCIKLNLFNSELALVRVRSSAKIWYSLYDSFQGLVVLLKVSPT